MWLKDFFIKGLVFYLIIFIAFYSFHTVMSKLLNIKVNFFSHSHVNERHKKIDLTIKITFIVLLLLFSSSDHTGEKVWFYGICLLAFTFPITSETVRAFMEWKYEANGKAYILTVSRLVFGLILLCLMVATDFFGLL